MPGEWHAARRCAAARIAAGHSTRSSRAWIVCVRLCASLTAFIAFIIALRHGHVLCALCGRNREGEGE